MGDIADQILDGTLCQVCGVYVYDGNPDDATDDEWAPGHPRSCEDCKDCEE